MSVCFLRTQLTGFLSYAFRLTLCCPYAAGLGHRSARERYERAHSVIDGDFSMFTKWLSGSLLAAGLLVVSALAMGAKSNESSDCCAANLSCCNPPQACCSSAKADLPKCCAMGAACCEEAASCCQTAGQSATLRTSMVKETGCHQQKSASCCAPGAECCERGDACCVDQSCCTDGAACCAEGQACCAKEAAKS